MNLTRLAIAVACLGGACMESEEPATESALEQDSLQPPELPPACTYIQSGRVLGDATHHARIHNLYWGNSFWNGFGAVFREQITTAWKFLGSHQALGMALTQYGAGTNAESPAYERDEPYGPPPSVSDLDVQRYLEAVLRAEPPEWRGVRTANDLFVVYLPPGVTSTVDAAAGTDGHHWTFLDSRYSRNRLPVVTIPWHDYLDDRTMAAARGILDAIAHPDVAEGGRREVVEPCASQAPYRLNGYLVPRVYSNRDCGCVTTLGLGRSMKDFTRDGLADILWRNADTGVLRAWSVGKDNQVKSYGDLDWTQPGTQWQPRGTGDFNGDKKPDVVWHNPITGQVRFWYMNGTTAAGWGEVDRTRPGPWQLSTGDFNGDGISDLAWLDPISGGVEMWWLDAHAHVTLYEDDGPWPGPKASLVGTGDFDGDGYADLLWHDKITGVLSTWSPYLDIHALDPPSQPALLEANLAGNDWELKGTQDFDNDGLVDLIWHNAATGQVWIWNMSGYKVTNMTLVDWTATYPWMIVSR